ncbi:MAG: hypothetical protein M3512_18820 [Bacteroidota bacterium]|nr:hypothetical protein [Bacteroidota bacterium]
MGKIYFKLIVYTIIVCPIFFLINACSGSSERIENNIQNSQKLKVGMFLDEALKIMGEPQEVKVYPKKHPKYNSVITTYYYESPFGSSDLIHFRVDTTNTVVEITPYELPRK